MATRGVRIGVIASRLFGRPLAFGVFAMATIALPLRAQTGQLEGTIFDSVHARPLAGARVLAIRADSGAAHSAGATSNSRGRYRVDDLPAGRYMAELESPFLDSLEIYLPPRQLTILAGRITRADFGLPSGPTLRTAACPGVTLDKGMGAVVGRVLDADTEAPLGGARVSVAWRELTFDRAAVSVMSTERSGEVTTDSLGRYRLCGVPTDDWLVLHLQHRGRVGSIVRVLVPDSAGVRVQHLSLSVTASRAARADGTPPDTTTPPPLTGTASVAGVVRGVGELPLAEAQVRVAGASGSVVTDERGQFSLGDLPSGTQVLEVRRLGYLLAQQPVELRGGRTTTQDVRLQRIVTLDSILVLAQRSRYRDFEEHRRRNAFGHFLTDDELERRRPFQASDLFYTIPGFRVSGSGLDAKVVSSRGAPIGGNCEANVVIDGMPGQDINLLHPANIGAMEIYRPGQPGRAQYDRGCGVIVIWSKR